SALPRARSTVASSAAISSRSTSGAIERGEDAVTRGAACVGGRGRVKGTARKLTVPPPPDTAPVAHADRGAWSGGRGRRAERAGRRLGDDAEDRHRSAEHGAPPPSAGVLEYRQPAQLLHNGGPVHHWIELK